MTCSDIYPDEFKHIEWWTSLSNTSFKVLSCESDLDCRESPLYQNENLTQVPFTSRVECVISAPVPKLWQLIDFNPGQVLMNETTCAPVVASSGICSCNPSFGLTGQYCDTLNTIALISFLLRSFISIYSLIVGAQLYFMKKQIDAKKSRITARRRTIFNFCIGSLILQPPYLIMQSIFQMYPLYIENNPTKTLTAYAFLCGLATGSVILCGMFVATHLLSTIVAASSNRSRMSKFVVELHKTRKRLIMNAFSILPLFLIALLAFEGVAVAVIVLDIYLLELAFYFFLGPMMLRRKALLVQQVSPASMYNLPIDSSGGNEELQRLIKRISDYCRILLRYLIGSLLFLNLYLIISVISHYQFMVVALIFQDSCSLFLILFVRKIAYQEIAMQNRLNTTITSEKQVVETDVGTLS